ncbi:MAG: NAD(P)-dependent oxidoreductase [Candidatus Eremiobacteraeota bacterium]|nr:NAD(P)-dependent oxidoreductase [Candidatus Eremiobacteraeota bacterium]MBV8365667.1 NAD(P)-dependent oxidoreductase [Candidatus Eremiobacteraeota bacterium]
MKNVGLVGAGAMGEPMGASLLRAGFSLSVCAHRSRERVERLVEAGASEHKDAAAVAAASECVITMVPDSPQVEEALFGEHGVVEGMKPGGYVIDMSTISPVASRAFNKRLCERGIGMVDAPVSGGPARATTGELTIMAGGDDADYAACEPVLRAMGTPTHVGPAGMGETFKLVNQIIISVVMIADIEALVFAKKSGADIELLRKVIATATGSNYILDKWLPNTWFKGSHDGGFALDLLRKDLNAALDAAKQMQVPMIASALAGQLYLQASAEGYGRQDYSAVSELYERAAGVRVVS